MLHLVQPNWNIVFNGTIIDGSFCSTPCHSPTDSISVLFSEFYRILIMCSWYCITSNCYNWYVNTWLRSIATFFDSTYTRLAHGAACLIGGDVDRHAYRSSKSTCTNIFRFQRTINREVLCDTSVELHYWFVELTGSQFVGAVQQFQFVLWFDNYQDSNPVFVIHPPIYILVFSSILGRWRRWQYIQILRLWSQLHRSKATVRPHYEQIPWLWKLKGSNLHRIIIEAIRRLCKVWRWTWVNHGNGHCHVY